MKAASGIHNHLYRLAEKHAYKLALFGLANLAVVVVSASYLPEWVLVLLGIPASLACGISSGVLMFPRSNYDELFGPKS